MLQDKEGGSHGNVLYLKGSLWDLFLNMADAFQFFLVIPVRF